MRTELENKRIAEIKEILDNLSDEELLNIHNAYDDYGDNEIFFMDMFDEMCDGMTPTDIAQRIFFGDFNPNHNYFKYNGYANFESGDFPRDWIDISDIANYMYDNWESYNIDEVADLFYKWENEDEEEDEDDE